MAHADYRFMKGKHGMIVFRLDTTKGNNHVMMEILVGGMHQGLIRWGEPISSVRRLKHDVAGISKQPETEKRFQVMQQQTIEVN